MDSCHLDHCFERSTQTDDQVTAYFTRSDGTEVCAKADVMIAHLFLESDSCFSIEKITIESQDDEIPKHSLFVLLIHKDGGLGHITKDFDSILKATTQRLTKTNYTALEQSSLRSLPSGLYLSQRDIESVRCRRTER